MKIFKAGMIAALVMALTACGGGGGNSTGSVGTQSTTVTGTAAKGLVKHAQVLVCRIVNGVPEPDASCVSTTTGNDGAYSVNFSDGFTGAAMVKVMATATSTMVDETTGTDIPYPMTMRAVVPAISGTTTVHVTPFSEIAAHAASMTSMNATTIRQAINAMQSAMSSLGIDLSVMPMMDLQNYGANSTMLTMQSNMVKQLARVAMAAHHSNLLVDVNGVPCYLASSTASQQISCAVTAMSNMMNSYASADPTRMAAVVAALNGQDLAGVYVPVVRTDGTINMLLVNMGSPASMQAMLQNAGMMANMAANMTQYMMTGMH